MAEFEADENPILKCGPEFLFTSLSVWAKESTPGHEGIRPEKVWSSSLSYSAWLIASSTYSLKTYRLLTDNLWLHYTG
jgi:hypothetical protein